MPLLEIKDLCLSVEFEGRRLSILERINFDIEAGQAVGLVGESGSGKSMTAKSVIRLTPPSAKYGGEILFDGTDVLRMSDPELRRFRSTDVSMVFQDPFSHINPVRSIGDFLTEASRRNLGSSRAESMKKAKRLLEEVGIPEPEGCLRKFPHELSGGMLQRVMIASALMTDPKLLLADEPTTALDVTTQAEIMAIISDLRRDHGIAVLFITHDLELTAATCDRTLVMYAGSMVEEQDSKTLHETPLHPYTEALIRARPHLTSRQRPIAVPGHPVAAYEAPSGCPFSTRCAYVQDRCAERPPLSPVGSGSSACWRSAELAAGEIRLDQSVERVA